MPTSQAISARFAPLGDSALILRVGDQVDRATFDRVQAVTGALQQSPPAGMVECVPAYMSIAIYYDPLVTSAAELQAAAERALFALDPSHPQPARTIDIPVCYGGELGEDLTFVAEHCGLSSAEVVDIHSSADYLVHMIGFAPGFPYLGGMSARIATPRRETPRTKTPAGSVGIAGAQTGIYPLETPGGWQIIGRTPLALFRPWQDPPSLLQAGDIVRFSPITPEQFHALVEADS